jgi:hypothetical protein
MAFFLSVQNHLHKVSGREGLASGAQSTCHQLFSSPASRHSCCHAALLARSLLFFSPHTAPLELKAHLGYNDAPFHSIEPSHFWHSLVTPGACSAKEFSRPPAQLAAPSCVPAEPESAYALCPLCTYIVKNFIRTLYCSRVALTTRLQYIPPILAIAERQTKMLE